MTQVSMTGFNPNYNTKHHTIYYQTPKCDEIAVLFSAAVSDVATDNVAIDNITMNFVTS